MKANRIILTVLSLLAAAAAGCLVSCSSKHEIPYLGVSVDRYTFMGNDDYVLKVAVSSNNPWKVECDAQWVQWSVSGDTLEISVMENVSGEVREGIVEVLSAEMEKDICISQLTSRFNGRFEDLFYLGQYVAMSRNGLYVCGMKSRMEDDGTYIYNPVIVNTRTGEQTVLDDIIGYDAVMAISDDASLIVLREMSGALSMLLKDGEEVEVSLPSGCTYPFVSGISADGSVMVGFCKNANLDGYKPYVPVRWVNGVPEILPYPDHTVWGEEYLMDTMARGCSGDGSVIFGSEWTDFGLLYWKDGSMFFPGQDYADTENMSNVASESTRMNVSMDGKYVGCFVRSASGSVPAVINTEDNSLITLDGVGDGCCIHVTDDGTAFCCSPSVGSNTGYVVDVNTGVSLGISEWMQEKYGIILSSNRYVEQVSSDGKTILGTCALESPLGTAYVGWYCYVGE